jgi:hypothetical protein
VGGGAVGAAVVAPGAPRQARNSSPVGVAPASFNKREPI